MATVLVTQAARPAGQVERESPPADLQAGQTKIRICPTKLPAPAPVPATWGANNKIRCKADAA